MRGGQGDLLRARLADGAVRPFLETRDRDESWPFWSEPAHALVFQSDPAGGRAPDLWLWRPGAEVVPLAADPERVEFWPEWSPDGARVAFAWETRARGSGLAWIEVASGRETLALRAGPRESYIRPIFSPDGSWLAAQRRLGRGDPDLCRVDANGARPLTGESGWAEQKPTFARDGRTLLFTRNRPGAPRQIARIDADGRVRRFETGGDGADEHSARPSPAREEVAFVSDREGTRDVWLAPLAGGPARNLSRTPDRDEFAPRWSPDGARLVVTISPPRASGRAGDRFDAAARETLGIAVLDRDGRVLFETPGMMADWMPPF